MHPEEARGRWRVFGALGLVLFLAVTVGCTGTKKYALQGEVVGKNVATNEITVKYGDIPRFMPAMAMPYHVQDPAVVQELQSGDKIAAEGFVNKDTKEYWLEDVRITDESGRSQLMDETHGMHRHSGLGGGRLREFHPVARNLL